MGEQEFSKCNICGQHIHVNRKYYYYNVKCECCNGLHFEIVKHCINCKPKSPKRISLSLSAMTEKS